MNDDISKVLATFKDAPGFMEKHISARTKARHATIENAPPEVRALEGQGYTQEFIHRLAKLLGSDRDGD